MAPTGIEPTTSVLPAPCTATSFFAAHIIECADPQLYPLPAARRAKAAPLDCPWQHLNFCGELGMEVKPLDSKTSLLNLTRCITCGSLLTPVPFPARISLPAPFPGRPRVAAAGSARSAPEAGISSPLLSPAFRCGR